MAADPAEARAAADPLVEAYLTAWRRVQALQDALRDDPSLARQKEALDRRRRGIERELRELSDRTDAWTKTQLPAVYAAGGERGAEVTDDEFTWTAPHRAAAEQLSGGLYRDLLAANTKTAQTTRELIRKVGRDRALATALEGKTAVQAGREMARILDRSGIHSVVYQNGAKHGLGEYAQMAIRTVTAQAYNEGTIREASDAGVLKFEVFDGATCGWTRHDDTSKAHGRIVDQDEALAHPVSHPNCRRAFEGRPDLGRVEKPRAVSVSASEQFGAKHAKAFAKQSGDPGVAAQVGKALAHEHERLPKVAGKLLQTEHGLDSLADRAEISNATCACYHPRADVGKGKGRIHLSATAGEDQERWKTLADRGWWTRTADDIDPIQGVLSHEFGHHVDHQLLGRDRVKLFDAVAQSLGLPAPKVRRNAVRWEAIEAHNAWVAEHKDAITQAVSRYGSNSSTELLAEVWREYSVGGENARPNIAALGELMFGMVK